MLVSHEPLKHWRHHPRPITPGTPYSVVLLKQGSRLLLDSANRHVILLSMSCRVKKGLSFGGRLPRYPSRQPSYRNHGLHWRLRVGESISNGSVGEMAWNVSSSTKPYIRSQGN